MASGTIRKPPTLNWTNGSQDLSTSTNVAANWDGFIQAKGGNNGTTVIVAGENYSVPANTVVRIPVRKAETMRYTGGPYSAATLYYRILSLE